MIKSIATFSAFAAVARAQTYPYPSLTPTGDQWTAWSEWAGCDNLSLEDFCSFPDNYLANSVRYRECRLIDSEDHEWDPAQNASQVQPPKGDPAQTLNFDGLPDQWKAGIPLEQSSPSIRLACDPRLEEYMAAPPAGMPVYNTVEELEAAISTDPELFRPYIPAPYKRIVFEFALCINVHKCPKPLPWSSWNCHCLGTGEDNIENLPLCGCNAGQTTRSRVQLCKDWDRDDGITCDSVGRSIANNPQNGGTEFPNQCINTVNTNVWTQEYYGAQARKNWYQQVFFGNTNSRWVQKGDANRDNNLDATYRITPSGVNGFYDYSYDVNRASDGFSTQSGYINQCFDNSRYSSNTNGRVLNFLMNYADIRNDVEYGYQEMTCQNVAAQWSNWSAWGRCSQSCAGGVTQRTRSCTLGGVVANDLAGNAGCGCPGSATESQPCNTFCCPVWQICTAETCGNSDWTPLTAQNSADFGFGACPDCGDKTLELTRHCKCQEADGRFRFGDLTVPAFSTTFAHFQHDCTLATGETVENSFAGIPYIAKQTKVCDGSCCEGWQPWGEWGACDDSCFDSQNGALNATDFPRFQSRQRTCGCNGTEVATDFSNCPSLDGTQFLPLETEQRACASTPNPCPYWAPWGPYSACSATCRSVLFDAAAAPAAQCTADPADAGALRTRERGCLFGDVGSAGCPEPDRSETIACQLGDCCQYDQWSAWGACLTDAGESCTANGQPGKRTRQRNTVCGDPTVCDNCNHVEECELPKCPAWAEWGHWSECSMSCGQGTKSRTRDCCGAAIGSDACPCHGDFDIPQCDFGGDTCTNYYKTGAQLALWTARVDNNLHDANDQGYIDIMDCQVKPVCPYLQKVANSNELMWTEWSSCSVTCGNGVERRQRVCVFGQLGVDPECSGMIHEDRPCSGLPCPRVTEWEAWSDCSVTCGMGGDRSRVRTCEKPANVTADCTEPLVQNQACRNSPCPMLTMWSQWTACSEECDSRMGVTTRERTCEHGMIGEDGCDESAYQSQFCNQDVPCPSWGSWSAWTACREISQNIFAHSRTRSCVNGPLGSRECPVDGADQEAPCDSEFCAQTQVGGISDDNEVYIPRGAATSVLISFTSFLLALFL